MKSDLILIVDDNQKNIQVLGTLLSSHNYKIIVANNGVQALKIIDKYLPDLILLDINMPEMDGFEACKILKSQENTKEIPIIFLSAKVEKEDIVKGFKLGAVDYVTKPFDHLELVTRVNTHLSLRNKTLEVEKKNNEVHELIRVLLHDIANPLSGIKGIVDIGQENPAILEKGSKILATAVDNCFAIINNVRKMRALDDGKSSLTISPNKLDSMIKESLLIFQTKLLDKMLKVNVNIDSDLEAILDRDLFINSVFNNLLTNAIKFSPKNSSIDIEAKKVGEKVEFLVKDYGIGIPEEILVNLFAFNKSTSRKGTNGESGTGYGMPIVKKIVEMFEGEIHIESSENPPSGTIIKLILKAN
ncbi:MAG: hybrid sensor histidine kinase/response regulator [Leptospiraceae bacterium]|nr:hybrid sensor histidine kinase/response regulator [Leptospiraceae bacterium]